MKSGRKVWAGDRYIADLKDGKLNGTTTDPQATQMNQRKGHQAPAQPAPLPAQSAPATQVVVQTPAPAPAAGGTPPPSGNNPTGGSGNGGQGGNTPTPPPSPEPKGWEKFKTDQPGLARLLGLIIGVAVVLFAWVALARIQVWTFNDMNSIPARPVVSVPTPEQSQPSAPPASKLVQSCYTPEPGETSAQRPLVLGAGNCVTVPVRNPRETCLAVRTSAPPSEVSGVQGVMVMMPTLEGGHESSRPGAYCNGTCRNFIAANLNIPLCVRQAEGQVLSLFF